MFPLALLLLLAAGTAAAGRSPAALANASAIFGVGDDQELDVSGLPRSVDWRAKGAVTPVKNQGGLGSCWAFAAVATVESLHYIKKGSLVSLSEQQLVDCVDSEEKRSPRRGLEWIANNGGITTEKDYPYTGNKGTCDQGKLKNHAAKTSGYKRIDDNTELALMAAVARQPVAVGVAVDASFFRSYKGGIYSGPCVEVKNHCLTVVGYGEKGKDKFWIAKNSFGTGWGDKGYVLLKRGLPGTGLCKIAHLSVYPTM
ncbi:unnamed protein product [Urochloa humidicola]